MKNFLKKRISPPLLKYSYNKQLEQYRGLCALLVLITHAVGMKNFLINDFSWPEFIHYIGAGYLSVLVFFCISGYVIAVSNDQNLLNIKLYLKKRFIRLYPVYLITILLCVAIAKDIHISNLIGNLFFLQNDAPYWQYRIPVFVNYVTWSLNYEVFYYTLFIPLFLMRPKVWQMLLVMLLFSVILLQANSKTLIFAHYLNGYYFWIIGLFFGWKIIQGNESFDKPIPLLSMLFIQLCQNHLEIGAIILHVFNLHLNTNFNWIFDIPFCIMIMGMLTNTSNLFLKMNKIFCYTLPIVIFIYLILHNRIFENERWIMCLVFWIFSLLLYREKKISALILHKLTPIGKISYSLYLLHVPVALLIKKVIFISNRPAEIIVKNLLWIAITFGLSFVLEIYFQPAVKKYFDQNLKIV
ncbi:MAG: acyltransferase [Sphingobacteriaceae bacterium]|nr:MAG: acyltransferase [Sphingobacteriaceae bacterium]